MDDKRYTEIQEEVDVMAHFPQKGQCEPIRFRWEGRVYKPLKLIRAGYTLEGDRKIHQFSVEKKGTTFELLLDESNFRWKLARMSWQG